MRRSNLRFKILATNYAIKFIFIHSHENLFMRESRILDQRFLILFPNRLKSNEFIELLKNERHRLASFPLELGELLN